MKHIKLFEQFINEATLKPGKDEDLAKGIIAYFYAPEGTPEAEELFSKGLNPLRGDSEPQQQEGLSGWGKDAVRALSGARRIPSDFMLGNVISIAADNGQTYYFDGGDFVEGDKTIIKGAMKMTMREFLEELIKLEVIEKPTY